MELTTIIKEELYKVRQDKIVLQNILGTGTLNEAVDFNSILQRVKSYAAKGVLTATVLAGLMSSPAFSQQQKSQINAIATGGAQTTQTAQASRVTITPQVRQEWNNFIDWIGKTYPGGISDGGADPTGQIVAAYHQYNPATKITAGNIKDFQEDLKQYNDKWKTLQPNYHPQGATLSAPSPDDNRIGSITSKEKYPTVSFMVNGKMTDFGTDIDAAMKAYSANNKSSTYIDPNLTPQQRFQKNQALRAAGKPVPTVADMSKTSAQVSTPGAASNSLASN